MNEIKQRISIAEACGWSATGEWRYSAPFAKRQEFEKDGLKVIDLDLPDYLNDLNAMHEAEKCLSISERVVYYGMLWGMVEGHRRFNLINATAAQRAEAYLKTIGKWKESE